jgi:AraC family transcriptional regulator, positive regulator of tynA and feaB
MSLGEIGQARLIAEFSTETMPEKAKFPFFRDHISDVYCGIGPEQYAGAAFDAHYRAYECGEMLFAAMTTRGQRALRTRALRAARPDDSLFLNFCDTVDYGLSQNGRDATIPTGIPVLIDNERDFTFTSAPGSRLRLHSLRLPRSLFNFDIDAKRLNRANEAIRRSNAGAHLSTQMRLLCNSIAEGNLGVGRAMADPALQLIAHLLERAGDDGGMDRAPLSLASLKTIALDRAGHPEFSIGALARLTRTTSRTIQNRFAENGETFTGWLQEQRLVQAHERLAAAAPARGAISCIAFECGFRDLPHFNRLFRSRFGYPPGEAFRAG